ncbi:MAG: hypothetical protein ISS19_17550, partial [Bacteroidales bacterium]|nr:hypothetical protein [Bacteroidales bacterium]
MKRLIIMKTDVLISVIVIMVAQGIYGQGGHQHRHRYHGGHADANINIVCSFSDYAAIAEEIAREHGYIQ